MAGRSELPAEANLARLAGKLGVPTATTAAVSASAGGASAAASGKATSSAFAAVKAAAIAKGAAVKLVGVTLLVSSATTGAFLATRSPAREDVAERSSAAQATPTTEDPAALAPPAPLPLSEPSAEPPRPAPTSAGAPRVSPRAVGGTGQSTAGTQGAGPGGGSEMAILDRAEAALRDGRFEDALAACRAHAREYSEGMLAQEREVIAIEALARNGRREEARARARTFNTHVPELEPRPPRRRAREPLTTGARPPLPFLSAPAARVSARSRR